MIFFNQISKRKQKLRLNLKDKLSRMRESDIAVSNSIINDKLINSLNKRISILCYYPLLSEPDIKPSIERWLEKNYTVSLPCIEDENFHCYKINNLSKDNLIKSTFGVWEPNPNSCELISSDSIDTILVPGLGFTQNGERLGRGGGYYDKFLATCKSRTKLIGICFKEQIINNLPREKHDRLVTNIVTA